MFWSQTDSFSDGIHFPSAETLERMRESMYDFRQVDYSDQYNTPLPADKVDGYNEWVKKNGREKDIYDYDIQGAYLAGVAQSEDGHFPDTFKKPNHPTFSVESKYASEENIGGRWSVVEGKNVFRTGRKVTEAEAKYLQAYFAKAEPNAVLNLDGMVMSKEEQRKKIYESSLGSVAPDVGLFDGALTAPFVGFWSGVRKTANFLGRGLENMVDTETAQAELSDLGISTEKKTWEKFEQDNKAALKSFREYTKKEYGVDPNTMGTVAQILHGLFETIPKAVGYSLVGGPTAGAVVFGLEQGVNRADELMDEGVDASTAKQLGAFSALMASVALRVPPALGNTRLQSMIWGGASTTAVSMGELQGIQYVLENQNYDRLAKQYDVGVADIFTMGALGTAMGAAFFRGKALKPRTEKPIKPNKPEPTEDQVAAARTAQNIAIDDFKSNFFTSPHATLEEGSVNKIESDNARKVAIGQIQEGTQIDVSENAGKLNVDTAPVNSAKRSFGREVQIGEGDDSIVVLQNRKRDSVPSIGQMNSIAANPIYGKLSLSRDNATGAPIVSFGEARINEMPIERFGNTDTIYLSDGTAIPQQYVVMEASDIQASNDFAGNENPVYGDKTQINVVSGNGRVAGIKESYRRGTSKQYRDSMTKDGTHGISPETIKGMKEPILVRIMPAKDVTTRFVEESNNSQVLVKSIVETAHQDAPLIKGKSAEYEFDEAGNPTTKTVKKFLEDIHETNSLGEYLTSDGRPNMRATERINAAVFYEAYKSDKLIELFIDTDNNIKRVLNAMAALAPKVIELREMGLDLSKGFSEGANAIKAARDNSTFGKSMGEQVDAFTNQASLPFTSVIMENANSGKAIRDFLGDALDYAKQRMESSKSEMFGDTPPDLAEIAKYIRDKQNKIRKANEEKELPDIDVEKIRAEMKAAQEIADKLAQEQAAKKAEAELAAKLQSNAPKGLNPQTVTEARVEEIFIENPNESFLFETGNGETAMNAMDAIESAKAEMEKATSEANGVGEAMVCALRNGGI